MRLQTANRANEDLTISYAINYIEQFVKKHKIDLCKESEFISGSFSYLCMSNIFDKYRDRTIL